MMTDLNKKRINFLLEVLGFMMLVSLVVLCGYFYSANEELKSIVSEQNEYLKSSTFKDSIRNEKSENLQASLDSYSNAISQALGKGDIDPDVFLKSYKKLESERDSLKTAYNYAKEIYGFEILFKKRRELEKDSSITTYTTYWAKENTPADSARMLLPSYRKTLIYNPKNKSWTVDPNLNH